MKDYSFGNNIYELRNARRLSQKALGSLLWVIKSEEVMIAKVI